MASLKQQSTDDLITLKNYLVKRVFDDPSATFLELQELSRGQLFRLNSVDGDPRLICEAVDCWVTQRGQIGEDRFKLDFSMLSLRPTLLLASSADVK